MIGMADGIRRHRAGRRPRRRNSRETGANTNIRRLIAILHRLVDEGHTVVVIEHHMAVAAEADWILDLGPEAGDGGGEIVAQGPPEKIILSKKSRTAPFLKAALRI